MPREFLFSSSHANLIHTVVFFWFDSSHFNVQFFFQFIDYLIRRFKHTHREIERNSGVKKSRWKIKKDSIKMTRKKIFGKSKKRRRRKPLICSIWIDDKFIDLSEWKHHHYYLTLTYPAKMLTRKTCISIFMIGSSACKFTLLRRMCVCVCAYSHIEIDVFARDMLLHQSK